MYNPEIAVVAWTDVGKRRHRQLLPPQEAHLKCIMTLFKSWLYSDGRLRKFSGRTVSSVSRYRHPEMV